MCCFYFFDQQDEQDRKKGKTCNATCQDADAGGLFCHAESLFCPAHIDLQILSSGFTFDFFPFAIQVTPDFRIFVIGIIESDGEAIRIGVPRMFEGDIIDDVFFAGGFLWRGKCLLWLHLIRCLP